MNVLVGYTGFVGSNIYEYGTFQHVFNSQNIEHAYGLKPDILIYAGLRGEKYVANHEPDNDMELILKAEENIKRIEPKKLVLISTVDVFKNPRNVDEKSPVETENLHPYGFNRYKLECWARDNYKDALIIRLPALFGKNMKKNFIYDYIKRIPFKLTQEKLCRLTSMEPELEKYYTLLDNGYYQCKSLTAGEEKVLKQIFISTGFSALNFTDSRSVYQFYPLNRLWNDIQIALDNHILLWHPAVEPVSAGELYGYLTGGEFKNELGAAPAVYDYKTIYDVLFGGKNGYILSKDKIMLQIKGFTDAVRK